MFNDKRKFKQALFFSSFSSIVDLDDNLLGRMRRE